MKQVLLAYNVGIDLGANSCGWARIQLEPQADLADMGSLVFPEAGVDEPSKGKRTLNNHVRVQHRRARITLRRRRQRRQKLYNYLAEIGLCPADPVERAKFLCLSKADGQETSPYFLRERAVQTILTPREFARVLCHLNQRRGYLSTRDLMADKIDREYLKAAVEALNDEEENLKSNAGQDEEREALEGVNKTMQYMEETGAKTVGQLVAILYQRGYSTRKFNLEALKKKKGKYARNPKVKPLDITITRNLLKDEFEFLWQRQAQAQPNLWTPERKEQIFKIIFDQKPLESKSSLRKRCPLFPGSPCAAIASQHHEHYRIIQDLVQLKFQPKDKKQEARPLTREEFNTLKAKLLAGETIERKDLEAELGGTLKKSKLDQVEKGAFRKLRGDRGIEAMRQALGPDAPLAELQKAREVFLAREWANDRFELAKTHWPDRIAAKIALANMPKGYSEYSKKALRKLGSWMEDHLGEAEGQQAHALIALKKERNEIRAELERTGLLTPEELPGTDAPKSKYIRLENFNLRNPIVERSIRSAVYVLNRMIHQYGRPQTIFIEMPRDMAKPIKAQIEDLRWQKENEKKRNAARERLLKETELPPTKANIEKLLLAEECDWTLPYEGITFSPKDLIHLEVEHVLPRSRMYLNDRRNKVLVKPETNKEKGDRLPLEWLRHNPDRLHAYITRVNGYANMSKGKKAWLQLPEPPSDEWLNSQLTNTSYAARELKRILESQGFKVYVSKGQITAELRHRWELNGLLPDWFSIVNQKKAEKKAAKQSEEEAAEDQPTKAGGEKSRSDHRHHAIDAVVIALSGPGVVKRISSAYAKRKPGEKIDFKEVCPIPNLRQKIANMLPETPVVIRPSRQPKGGLNEATARTPEVNHSAEPNQVKIVDKKMVRFNQQGQPAQSYDLGNNHHFALYHNPNAKPRDQYRVVVVTTVQALENKRVKGDAFVPDETLIKQGYQQALTLCANDLVTIGPDRLLYRVAKMTQKGYGIDAFFQLSTLSTMDNELIKETMGPKDPHAIMRITSPQNLCAIYSRVVLDPLGNVTHEVLNPCYKDSQYSEYRKE